MRKIASLSSLILLLSAATLWGGTASLGLPLVRSFSEKEYRFHNQNWAITQDASGVLFVGNNSGIMEYDGQQWRTMTLANQSRVRAITCARDGRIYVGATGFFGRLEPDAAGRNQFKLLSDRLPERYRKFEDVWDAVTVGQSVLFMTTDYLFLVDGDKIQTIQAADCSFYKVFNLRGEILISTEGKGLMRLHQGRLEPVPEFPGLEKEKLTAMLPLQDGRTLIATRSGLLRIYSPGKMTPDDTTLLTPILKFITAQGIYHGLQLRDGRLILATLESGIIALDPRGRLLWKIDKTAGLLGNMALNLFQDHAGNLWVALNQGLAILELSTPLLYLDDRLGMDGTGLSVACMDKPLKMGDPLLYLGTHSNVFYVDPNANTPKVMPMDHQIWQPLDLRETPWGVLCVNRDGLYLIEGRRTRIIERLDHALCLAPLPGKPSDWLMGTERGLCLISYQDTKWKVKSLPGLSERMRFIFVQHDGTIWGTHEFRGLWSMRLSSDLSSVENVRHFTRKNGLPDENSLRVAEFQGQLRFLTSQGFYRFNEDYQRCIPDQGLNSLIKGYVGLPCQDTNGRLWCVTGSSVSILTPNPKGNPTVDATTLARLQDFTIANSIRVFDNGVAFFTTSNGFAVYVPAATQQNPVALAALIRSVENTRTQHIIFEGASERLPQEEGVALPFKQNALRFNFALPSFVLPGETIFRHQLEGLDQDWSKWDNKTEKEFNNLPPGGYHFRVQAKDYQGTLSRITSFGFSIRAPWYRTWWAYLIYLLFGALIFVGGLRLYTWRLIAARKRLQNEVRERTQEVVRQKDEIQAQAERLIVTNDQLEKLSIVASETDNAVMIMDEKANIEWVNPGFTRLYGLTLDELYKRNGNNLITASLNPKIKEVIEECLRDKKSVTYEASMLTKNGQSIWAQTTLTPILDDKGHVKKLVTIDSDITKIKEAEAAADKANQSKSEFLSRMSHEIRTPMNGVIGFTEMLLDTELSEEQMDFARTINRSGEALITLLNDILDFSKIEAGELTFDPIDFDPEMTFFDICDLILPRVGTKPVEILCRIGDRVPAFINSDPGRFRQVVVNLMGNAAKFTENGEIELSLDVLEEKGNRLKLLTKVRDTGIGIRQDQLVRVFEPFQQADGSTTRKYGGTGLGLSICRQISRLMGGEVWAESTLNHGSTFNFTCWVNQSQKQLPKATQRHLLDGHRALIIDDNPTNLDILANTLKLANLKVIQASDPKTVIETLKKSFNKSQAIDICIIDIQMPGISGFDLAREIRKQGPPIGDIPLLAFSSSTLSRSRKFQDAGFNGFLPKPIRRRKLIKMVERLLGFKEDAAEESKPEVIITQHSINEESKHSLHILLAEDNPINQKLARFMLEKAGYTLTLAMNGEEAVEKFCQDPDGIDMILMDIQMPKMDGKEATKQIRKKGYKDIPIIAMTAEAMKGDREKCIVAGMNDYIAKPIKRSIVFAMLKKYCLDK